ncbi:hypothetical protein M947_04720 [Sulfurimonas hongkongensis]|uniref:Uncharacterized protein n=1 Tax=Sulfurimonas hongkongensis TaxID=1172190 RepID=T0JSE2_9BACT|nr:hypothetical protein [Sulfurimonas hongkongensis]EQB39887.1 hypothetical protein M947_04720 [Sulfurimonas hongkongensis]
MFVKSYNTYITTNPTEKSSTEKLEKRVSSSSESFESKPKEHTPLESKSTQSLPINYISNYKVLSNKQKMQKDFEDKETQKFSKINTLNSAKDAYDENSKLFSLFLEPKITQSQTPQIDKTLPSELQVAQERQLRHTMVNTYLANDSYYKITA